jgi:tetratricopeptide (TPR) repeat protein
MADRFTYLPHVGLVIAVVWGVAEAAGRRGVQAAATVGILFLAIFAARTSAYIPFWRDSITLWRHTVAVTYGNPAAQHYLAAALEDAGLYDEAFPHRAEAVRLEPGYFVAQTCYASLLARRGRREEASEHYRAALRTFPGYPEAQRLLEENEKLLDLSKASGSKLKSER